MLAERLGWPDPHGSLQDWEEAQRRRREREDTDEHRPVAKQQAVESHFRVMMGCRLLDRHERAATEANGAVDATIEYLFGDWRRTTLVLGEPRDESWWRQTMWDREYLIGMACALATGRPEDGRRIAPYAGRDLIIGTRGSRALAAFNLLVGQFLTDGPDAGDVALAATVSGGGNQRWATLGQTCTSIIQGDLGNAVRLLTALVDHYHARRKRAAGLDDIVSLEGTILYHLLRGWGASPDLSRDQRQYLLDFVTCPSADQ